MNKCQSMPEKEEPKRRLVICMDDTSTDFGNFYWENEAGEHTPAPFPNALLGIFTKQVGT